MSSAVSAGTTRLPRQRRDRRAALSALALLLVVAGALGSALVVYRTGHRSDVLVASHTLKAGERIKSSDFGVARIASDGAAVLPASARKNFVGTFATTEIPEGTLLNRLMFQVGSVLPADGVVVGVTLSAAQRPAQPVAVGDIVRAYLVAKTTAGGDVAAGQVIVNAARVTDVSGSSASADAVAVSLLVTEDDAKNLVTAAGQSEVALAELPKTTKPAIDFQTSS